MLIAVAVGNMTGRLLAVNSVDKVQLEATRIRERLSASGPRLADEGVTERTDSARLAADEARLRNELRLQRPFLSANDRSRWMTIRSLVEHGTYEIDEIVGQPTWDTIDMVQHAGRDGELHLLLQQAAAVGDAAGRRVLADPSTHRRDAGRSSVRNRPRRCCSRSTSCR